MTLLGAVIEEVDEVLLEARPESTGVGQRFCPFCSVTVELGDDFFNVALHFQVGADQGFFNVSEEPLEVLVESPPPKVGNVVVVGCQRVD